jgi:hypothetical protein
MTYTTNTNESDLLYGNEWDEFTSDILEEFEEKPGGRRRGCLRVVLLLILIAILLGAGAYYITNQAAEEEAAGFEDDSLDWLENASTVVTNYETAIAGESLDCTTVLSDDPAYQLGDIPTYDGSDEQLLEVHSLLTNVESHLLELRAKITPVCGTNETVSNAGWVSIARPEGEIANARRDIQQAETLLDASE